MKRKTQRFRSIIALITMLALCLTLCVTQAFAVTQAEIDEIQRQKDELTAMRQQNGAYRCRYAPFTVLRALA